MLLSIIVFQAPIFTARRYALRKHTVFAVARCPSVRHVGVLYPDG